jgi:hypothetical protein
MQPLKQNPPFPMSSNSLKASNSTFKALNFLSNDSHKSCTIVISIQQPHRTGESRSKSHLVESSHRLIGTPNLHLKECRSLPVTAFLRTLHLCLVCIIPSSRPAEHVLSLFPCEGLALVISFLEDVLVGASLTFESIYSFVRVSFSRSCRSSCRNGEDIAAGGADWNEVLVLCLVQPDNSTIWEVTNVQSNILTLYVNLQVMAFSTATRRA